MRYRLIDPATGKAPVLEPGQGLSFTTGLLGNELVAIPDGLTEDGQPFILVEMGEEEGAEE